MSSSLRVNTIVPSTGTNVAIGTANGTVTFTDSVNFVLGTGSSIFSPASNTLTFGTNDEERLRITSTGIVKVGANTLVTPSTDADNFVIDTGDVDSGISILSATTGRIYFGDAADNDVGSIRYVHTDNSMRFETDTSERLRIDSSGRLNIGSSSAPGTVGGFSHINVHGTGINANGAIGLYRNSASPSAGQGIGAIYFANSDGNPGAYIQGQSDGTWGTNDYPGRLVFFTTSDGASSATERLRIDSAGTIKCGTSATLKAEINSAIGGHQFISQCSDNNNGFEIYQQHGSTTTRNTFAVYANTGGGGAQELQFSIRGDGCVTKPKSPAFSANLAGSNLNMATHNSVIVFNNQHFDTGNNYNTSNGRFTAPVAGRYYFGVQIYAGFGSGAVRVLHAQFQKNGSDVAAADMFGGTSDAGGTSFHPTGCGHMMIDLAANDWVAFNSGGFSGSGSGHRTIYAASGTRFFGYLVG